MCVYVCIYVYVFNEEKNIYVNDIKIIVLIINPSCFQLQFLWMSNDCLYVKMKIVNDLTIWMSGNNKKIPHPEVIFFYKDFIKKTPTKAIPCLNNEFFKRFNCFLNVKLWMVGLSVWRM